MLDFPKPSICLPDPYPEGANVGVGAGGWSLSRAAQGRYTPSPSQGTYAAVNL